MSTLKPDIQHTHGKNLGDKIVGEFCGSPIRELYRHEVEIDQTVETARTIEINRRSNPPFTAELLPGEVICEDNVIRRGTTAEALGEVFYDYELPEGAVKVTIEKGRELAAAGQEITFRPNRVVGQGEFAILHTEVAA